ncbi:MAG TPA: type II toxin-antitoxin system HicB family antitoxin [Chthoniobacterales bacterium]
MKLPPLTAIFERGEDGWLVVTCPELDITTQGETMEQAEMMIREAVELWLECANDAEIERRLNKRVAVKSLELSHA